MDALNRFVFPHTKIAQLIVCGGGVRNPLLMCQLEAALAPERLEIEDQEMVAPIQRCSRVDMPSSTRRMRMSRAGLSACVSENARKDARNSV